MNTYTYEFATGNKEIEISEEWMKVLEDLDRVEYNNDQTETRRHTSYSNGDDGEWMTSKEDETSLMDKIEAGRLMKTAKECLSERQFEVFIAIAAKDHTFSSYAKETGMTKQFVRKLYIKAVSNLKRKTKTEN